MSGLIHYWHVIRDALRADRAARQGRLASHEGDFLPAALAVVERPVSPTGRATAWLLMAGLGGILLWITLGQVDIVASAPGKIVLAGNIKIVQSAGSGVVAAIRVRDGDRVRKGQVLLELDTTLSGAELEQTRNALLATDLEVARNRAFVEALDGRGLHFVVPVGTPADVAATQQQLVMAQLAEMEATIGRLRAEHASALAQVDAAGAEQSKLDASLPILDHELAAMRKLDANGYAPGLRLLELQRQRRVTAGDRDVAAAQGRQGAFEASKYIRQIAEVRTQARRQALADLAKAENDAILKRQDVTKAARRTGLQRLVAPEDGTVQQLKVHTIGGVVEPARTLMVVVPANAQVEVEARVLNKDIGFVHEGQAVTAKIDAFPFTRYGTVPGRVVSLSRDAVADADAGATYVATIRLARGAISVDGKWVRLTAGQRVVIDIRTGRRSILSWLLSPLQTTVSQAGKER